MVVLFCTLCFRGATKGWVELSLCWSSCCFHSHTCNAFGLISTCSSNLISTLLSTSFFLVSSFRLSCNLILFLSTSDHHSDQHSTSPASQLQHLLTVKLTSGPLCLASPSTLCQFVACLLLPTHSWVTHTNSCLRCWINSIETAPTPEFALGSLTYHHTSPQ